MPRQSALRQEQPKEKKPPAVKTAKAAKPAPPPGLDLDRLIHEHTRLEIVSHLAVNESLSFNDLKGLLQTTDGNVSVHTRKLEEAGYVACEKTFVGRVPRTKYRLTAAGRKAFEKYLDHMEALIQASRQG